MQKQLLLLAFLLSVIHICKGDQNPLEGDLFLPTRADLETASTPAGNTKHNSDTPASHGQSKYAGRAPGPSGQSKYSAGIPNLSGSDSVTETTRTSWFDRVVDSFVGVLVGIILIVFGLPLLWFNERRAVETERVIKEGSRICKETTENNLDSTLNGQLVHVSGKATNPKNISDADFGISAENSAKLRRNVEVYQMRESKSSSTQKDQIGGGQTTNTTYSYTHVWSETKIDSFNFKNDAYREVNNSVKFVCDTNTLTAEQVNLGQFKLRPSQIDRLNRFQDIQIPSNAVNSLSKRIKEEIGKLGWNTPSISVDGNYLYIKKNKSTQSTPEIGDIRISFERVPLDWVTVVALQNGNSFEPYNIREKGLKGSKGDEEAGFCSGIADSLDSCCWTFCCCVQCMSRVLRTQEDIDWIYEQKMTKKEVFESELQSNNVITILLRILGIFLISGGIYLIFNPVIVLLSIIKLFGDIVGFAVFIVSVIIGLAVGLVVIAVAWIFYRPLLALAIFAVAGMIWGFVYFAGGSNKIE